MTAVNGTTWTKVEGFFDTVFTQLEGYFVDQALADVGQPLDEARRIPVKLFAQVVTRAVDRQIIWVISISMAVLLCIVQPKKVFRIFQLIAYVLYWIGMNCRSRPTKSFRAFIGKAEKSKAGKWGYNQIDAEHDLEQPPPPPGTNPTPTQTQIPPPALAVTSSSDDESDDGSFFSRASSTRGLINGQFGQNAQHPPPNETSWLGRIFPSAQQQQLQAQQMEDLRKKLRRSKRVARKAKTAAAQAAAQTAQTAHSPIPGTSRGPASVCSAMSDMSTSSRPTSAQKNKGGPTKNKPHVTVNV